MKSSLRKFLTLYVVGSFLMGCGIPDKVDKEAVVATQSVTCKDRSVLLIKGESATFHFDSGGAGVLGSKLDTGDSLDYLDWGSIKQNEEGSVVYSAPGFVPEARKMTIEGSLVGGNSTPGNCYAYLLDDFTYGVADDGNTRGLVAASYLTNDITKIDTLTAREKGVIRDFNFPSITGGFTGVSTLPVGNSLRITGTITTAAAAYWFRFRSSVSTGGFWIDGVRRGNSGNSGGFGAEIPATNSPTTVTPNYNTGIPLTAGKHTIQIDITHSANATYLLEWTTTRPLTTQTAAQKPYSPIPASAFDRD